MAAEQLTSIAKVQAFIEYQSKQMAGDAVGQAMMAMARPMLNLPDDPAVLDQQLVNWAQLCLAMRSDDAEPRQICDADGQPVPLPS